MALSWFKIVSWLMLWKIVIFLKSIINHTNRFVLQNSESYSQLMYNMGQKNVSIINAK